MDETPETEIPQGSEQDEQGWFHLDIHPQVFFISALLIIFFVVSTIVFQKHMGDIFQQ